MEYKIVYDPVHGTIRMDGVLSDLLKTPELNRLNRIRQLGLSYLVFPGAHHTRFEHSLGTSHVAGMLAEEIGLDDEEIELVQCAGLLHDLGHGPFSHTLEKIFHTRIGKDHMEVTGEMIRGSDPLGMNRDWPHPYVHEVLKDHGIDYDRVADLICQPSNVTDNNQDRLEVEAGQSYFPSDLYLYQLIHSAIDADQLDFLLRDSKYTGVAYGVIDLDRIVQTAILHHDQIMIHKRGLSALEGMLVARSLMYSSVYFHKTARIAESMLVRAAEYLDDEKLDSYWSLTDAEVLYLLSSADGITGDIARRLRFRRLFKSALKVESDSMVGDTESAISIRAMIKRLSIDRERENMERLICRRADVEEGYVIVDVPDPTLTLSEPRLRRTDISVFGGTVEPLSKISSLARALQHRPGIPWCLMVSCPEKYRMDVEKAAFKVMESELDTET
jgi:HD superfamily phosphohydrolase